MSESDTGREEINTLSRRLEKLKQKKAMYGLSADPSLEIEIEDIEAKLGDLQAKLAQVNASPSKNEQIISAETSSTQSEVHQIISGSYNAVTGPGGQATVNIYYDRPDSRLQLPAERLTPPLEHILTAIYRAEQETPTQALHLTGPEHMKNLGFDPDTRIHVQRCRILENKRLIKDETQAANVIYRHLRLTELGRRYCETHSLA